MAYTIIDNATQRPVEAGTCAGCHVSDFWAASNIAYEPFGGVSSMTYGNGKQITVTHNQQYQVQELQSGSILDRSYDYDGMGNITEIDRNSMPDDLTPVYPYSYTDDYSYSTQSASSILQIDNGDLTQTHAYYAHNIIGDVTVTKQYAIHGELTKEMHLTWNEDHRLTEVKNGANQTLATYTYNGLGQRVKKVAGSVTTIFLYDLQGNIISEMRSDGSYDDYLYLENQRIAEIFNGEGTDYVYYYHNDHLGTPIAMTNSSGDVVWKARYKAFGEAQVDSSSTITNNFRRGNGDGSN